MRKSLHMTSRWSESRGWGGADDLGEADTLGEVVEVLGRKNSHR